MKLIIEENRVVTLTYELRDGNANGELLERMDARYPFIFLFGTGKLLKSFEENTDDEGLRHNGKIIGIEPTQIEIDFNHAMVDKDLHFKGAVLAIREASIDELVQKHYIEESGVRK